MGARGPIPKHSSLKVLTGKKPITKENLQGGQQQNIVDFTPPEPPDHLTSDQLEIWHRTVEVTKHLRILEKIDVAVLAAYCCSFCMWRDAMYALNARKEQHKEWYQLTTGSTGGLVPHPLVNIARQASQDMVEYAKEMGMTPSVRMRMTMPEPPPTSNPFAKLKSQSNERVGQKS